MINAINLSILRNGEYLQFMKNVDSLVTDNDPVVLNVVAQKAALSSSNALLDGLFKTELANQITQELVLLDERRDKAIVGIAAVVTGFMYHYDLDKAKAGALLNDNLKLYGTGIAKQNYQAETATIASIVIDWETKVPLSDSMNLLVLKEWKDELKAINTLFDEKYLARTQEYAAANPDTLKIKREEGNSVYYTLRDFLNSFSIVAPSVANTKVINEINALVDQYNTLLNNRLAGGKEEETPPSV